MKPMVLALLISGLAGCTINPENSDIRPLEQPAAVATVQTSVSSLAECMYRQLDAVYSPRIFRTRPASGPDEIIYMGAPGIRQWEMTISPAGASASTVTFRSMNTIRGHDVFWREIQPQRAACGL